MKYENPAARIADDAFKDVHGVVFMLLQTHSWIRFRKSPLWQEYKTELEQRKKEESGQFEFTHSATRPEDLDMSAHSAIATPPLSPRRAAEITKLHSHSDETARQRFGDMSAHSAIATPPLS